MSIPKLDVHFSFPETYYDNGFEPSVAVANGTVVAIQQSRLLGPRTLHYNVGALTGGLVRFGPHRPAGNGMEPAIAINRAGTVVEVHETSLLSSNRMYYRVGRADVRGQTIDFGQAIYFGVGKRPRVALNEPGANDGGVVVEVHETSNRVWPSRKYCRVGTIDPVSRTISFGSNLPHQDGKTPAIAINSRTAIEVFRWRAQRGNYHLWYRVGTIDRARKTIAFDAPVWYDEHADKPSVALTEDGLVIAVHQSSTNNTLWSRVGRLNRTSRRIEWIAGKFLYLREATAPAVAIDHGVAVQVNRRGHVVQCAASLVIDRTSWMADHLGLIGNKKLMEIALPASHDAHMATAVRCAGQAGACQTQTQNHNIWGQLVFGCRYFDIRPVIYRNEMQTGHFSNGRGCHGQSMDSVLSDVQKYLEGGGRDLVILLFSHYWNRDRGRNAGFTDDDMRRLLNQVTNGPLRGWLYDRKAPAAGLQSVTVNDYIGQRGRVLAVFDLLKEPIQREYTGAHSYARKGRGPADLIVFDEYSGKNRLEEMVKDQLNKLAADVNHTGNLFLLSWTLTQSADQAINCALGGRPSVLDLAREANTVLWSRLVEASEDGTITSTRMPNLVYTDDIWGTQTDFVIWLNRKILGSRR